MTEVIVEAHIEGQEDDTSHSCSYKCGEQVDVGHLRILGDMSAACRSML